MPAPFAVRVYQSTFSRRISLSLKSISNPCENYVRNPRPPPPGIVPVLPDVQRRAPRQTRQKSRQIAGAQRHAARRRREIFGRDMKEDRAAAPAHGRANIMIEHANEVVEPIRTPQVLVAQSRRTAQMTIVKKAVGVVAPNIVLSRLARRREQGRPRKSAGSNKSVKQARTALGRRAVALAFVACETGAAQGAAQRQRSHDQPALMRRAADQPRDKQPPQARPRRRGEMRGFHIVLCKAPVLRHFAGKGPVGSSDMKFLCAKVPARRWRRP